MANTCPSRKKEAEETNRNKPDIGLFTSFYFPTTEKMYLVDEIGDLGLVVKRTLDNLVLLSVERHAAVVDCPCPGTVAGMVWIKNFFADMDDKNKATITKDDSERIFEFGGGEKRISLGVITFPCFLAGRNVRMRSGRF